ncbi:unnamed protein product [Colias eurytheme]|nr:unnamed protein product [Colias eurytheme]
MAGTRGLSPAECGAIVKASARAASHNHRHPRGRTVAGAARPRVSPLASHALTSARAAGTVRGIDPLAAPAPCCTVELRYGDAPHTSSMRNAR